MAAARRGRVVRYASTSRTADMARQAVTIHIPSYQEGFLILLAKSGGAGWAAYVAGIGCRSAAEGRHVPQAQPDRARARGDRARRPGRLPQGQPAPEAA